MTQPAKAQEPSMEEILASIRRIISDDETKPAPAQAAPEPPKPEPARVPPKAVPKVAPRAPSVSQAPAPKPAAPPPAAAKNSQDDIDAMLAGLDADTSEVEVRSAEPELENDVFELTEQMTIPEPAAPIPAQHVAAATGDGLEFPEPRSNERQDAPRLSAPEHSFELDAPPARPLMSSSTMASVESAFHTLANTVLSNNARTLEDLVKEMLRPMLKSWLDDNLPNMVERIIRAEIERVSRGR